MYIYSVAVVSVLLLGYSSLGRPSGCAQTQPYQEGLKAVYSGECRYRRCLTDCTFSLENWMGEAELLSYHAYRFGSL